MEVVINDCYGGFGLSDEAIEKCIELGMTVGDKDDHSSDFTKLKRSKNSIFQKKYYTRQAYGKEFRSNPIVIKVVEELGKDSWSEYAELKVVVIPFDTTEGWEIREYDGIESIHQTHAVWS